MKTVILHAMNQNSQGHWYPWLKTELEKLGYEVWSPDMPYPDMPNARKTTDFLLTNKKWNFQDNLLIGHSWGAVQALHLLQNLPENTKLNTAILVSSFDRPAKGMETQHEKLFNEPYIFEKIKQRANQFVFVHGDNDPWVPVSGAQNLAKKLGGELVVIQDGQHFSTNLDKSYTKFPKLLEIIKQKVQP